MPWEMRGANGPYYTRSRRVGGHVVREYVGKGPLGQLAAELDAEERARRRLEVEAARQEAKRYIEMDDSVEEFCRQTDAVVRGVLLIAGYHRHNRGEWRKRREREKETEDR